MKLNLITLGVVGLASIALFVGLLVTNQKAKLSLTDMVLLSLMTFETTLAAMYYLLRLP